MKKDKAFAEKGEINYYNWHVGYEPDNQYHSNPKLVVAIELANVALELANIEIYSGSGADQLRKFIQALKKGLRRLER